MQPAGSWPAALPPNLPHLPSWDPSPPGKYSDCALPSPSATTVHLRRVDASLRARQHARGAHVACLHAPELRAKDATASTKGSANSTQVAQPTAKLAPAASST